MSVYQQEEFHRALETTGVIASKVISIDGKSVYFMRAPDGSWIAWELAEFGREVIFPPAHSILGIDQIADFGEIDWANFSHQTPSGDYATLIATSDTPRSKRFKRGLKKAKISGLNFHDATTDGQIRAALDFISDCEDCIDPLDDKEAFTTLAIALLHEGIGQVHIVRDEDTNSIQAASLSLTSPHQANLRWYRSKRENNSGHLLIDRLISHHLRALGPRGVVNLSGVVSPRTTDKKLLGINEFKLQVSSQTVVFKRS